MSTQKPTNAILLLLFLGVVTSSSQYLHAQERDRLISTIRSGMRSSMSQPDGPLTPTNLSAVEVIGFNLAGVLITPDQPFHADDDWLKNLRVKVKNISGKSISHLHMIFALPEAKFTQDGRSYSMGFSLDYKAGSKANDGDGEMKVLLPGDDVELVFFEPGSPTPPLRQQIANRTGVTNITVLQYGGNVNVFFVDGVVWRGSNLPVGTGLKPSN